MIGWIIAGFIILLLIFLLACSVTVESSFEEELSVWVKFLFVRFRVLPQPPEQPTEEAPAPEKKPARKKPSKIKALFQKKGFWGFMELVKAFSRVAYGSVKKILSHTVIQSFSLRLTVGGEDAAQTAVNYGRVCGLLSTALAALFSTAKCKRRNVKVAPDFQNGKSGVQFRIRLKIRLMFLLSALLSAFFGMIKLYLKIRKESGNPDQKEKAVLKNG
ncbi:MAG: DUF2953 domain-containing protein [Oscillospiraceae bacterium]|jgi:hypothetical protein|nr:DUF2953 domain-containing protein [Oscillospiraceae bacterium]